MAALAVHHLNCGTMCPWTPPHCPPGLRGFQVRMQSDGRLRRENQERLRELARRDAEDVELICSHDPVYLEVGIP